MVHWSCPTDSAIVIAQPHAVKGMMQAVVACTAEQELLLSDTQLLLIGGHIGEVCIAFEVAIDSGNATAKRSKRRGELTISWPLPMDDDMAARNACKNAAHGAVLKKDMTDDKAELEQYRQAQQMQERLVEQHASASRQLVIASVEPLTKIRVWDSPAEAVSQLHTLIYQMSPKVPRRRVVFDGLASTSECESAVREAVELMEDLEERPDGRTSCVLKRALASFAPGLYKFLVSLEVRIMAAIQEHFGETKIFRSGSLLIRLRPPPAGYDGKDQYWRPHVDKANVPSYDFSGLVYLNSGGGLDFEGGDFAFLAENVDQVVVPRAGRALLFASGAENLHQVRRVTRGVRFALALWFTLSEAHCYKDKA